MQGGGGGGGGRVRFNVGVNYTEVFPFFSLREVNDEGKKGELSD